MSQKPVVWEQILQLGGCFLSAPLLKLLSDMQNIDERFKRFQQLKSVLEFLELKLSVLF